MTKRTAVIRRETRYVIVIPRLFDGNYKPTRDRYVCGRDGWELSMSKFDVSDYNTYPSEASANAEIDRWRRSPRVFVSIGDNVTWVDDVIGGTHDPTCAVGDECVLNRGPTAGEQAEAARKILKRARVVPIDVETVVTGVQEQRRARR